MLLNKSVPTLTTMTNLYWVMMPLGVAGCFQLNGTSVLVGVEIKSWGASSGPIWRIQICYCDVNLLSWAVSNLYCVAGPSPTTLIDDSLQVYSVNGTNTGIVNIVSVELWVAVSPETWDPLLCIQVKLYPTIFAIWSGGSQFNVTLRGRKVVLPKFLGGVV